MSLCQFWFRSAFVFLLLTVSVQAADKQDLDLGVSTAAQWEQVLASVSGTVDQGQKITRLSDALLGIPYRENSLIGGPTEEEVLVMDLSGVDCFTLLDYLEAFRQSDEFPAVMQTLKKIRYRNGQVAYRQRNHFFSDWPIRNDRTIIDITREIGKSRVVRVDKQLNLRADGSLWLPEIPVTDRQISYIPTEQIDRQVLADLRSGDYLGIYSDQPGLDVSHTGIVIKSGSDFRLRHASSAEQSRRVVDSDLLDYLRGVPGILVYRAR